MYVTSKPLFAISFDLDKEKKSVITLSRPRPENMLFANSFQSCVCHCFSPFQGTIRDALLQQKCSFLTLIGGGSNPCSKYCGILEYICHSFHRYTHYFVFLLQQTFKRFLKSPSKLFATEILTRTRCSRKVREIEP